MMVSRVRKGVIGGFLAVGVGVSGGLVGCSGSESSGSGSDSASVGSSRSSSKSTDEKRLNDELEFDLHASSLNGKQEWLDSKEPFIGIEGSIKNKTDKSIELLPMQSGLYFNCRFMNDGEVSASDPSSFCKSSADDTVTIPAHGLYSSNRSDGIVYVSDGPFDVDSYKGGNDNYRVTEGKKEFLLRFDRSRHSDESKNVRWKSAEAWIEMKGV